MRKASCHDCGAQATSVSKCTLVARVRNCDVEALSSIVASFLSDAIGASAVQATVARMAAIVILASHEGDVNDFGHDAGKSHSVLKDFKGLPDPR